jgi:hypothetical protein
MDLSKYVTVKVLSRPCSVGPFPARNAARPTGVPRLDLDTGPPKTLYSFHPGLGCFPAQYWLLPPTPALEQNILSLGVEKILPSDTDCGGGGAVVGGGGRRRRKVVCDCYHVRG